MAVPPDPNRVLQWSSGNSLRKKLGSSFNTRPVYWANDAASRSQRLANQIAWEHATGARPEDLEGALYVLGDEQVLDPARQGERGADPVINQVFEDGPYQMISYEDADGTSYTENIRDFYTRTAGKYLEQEGFYEERGYDYSNLGQPPTLAEISSVGTEAAPITLAPTSSIYPPRPRTVAAGYDKMRKVLTVVFRDGTFYNYYQVANLEWWNFVRSRSKGRYIASHLDGHPRGAASMGGVPISHREALYRLARTAQVKNDGRNVRQGPGSRGPRSSTKSPPGGAGSS